jgi:hypothetical protein
MQFGWMLFVKQLFNDSDIWETKYFNNIEYLKCVILEVRD